MTPSAAMSDPRSSAQVSPFAYPLDEFYAQAGRALPVMRPLPGEEVPEPYKRLLVHQGDMTSTLENFHGSKVKLNVLSRQQRDDFYYREVVLCSERTGEPVEFGAIKINLLQFEPAARRRILEESAPLGRIIHEHKMGHRSRPKAFLEIESDAFINSALSLAKSERLYARRNTLLNDAGQPLAEILEILPPSPRPAAS